MSESNNVEYILGLDLGTNSLGWALVGPVGGDPHHLIRAGARVFEAGVQGDIASGREESRNLKRRQMRSQRRQIDRRSRRSRRVFRLLQGYGLLPEGPAAPPEAMQNLLNSLDASIVSSPWFASQLASCEYQQPRQVMPYILRARALDEGLPPQYLGRALYHMAQRRGFKSNRKAPPKKDEKPGEVRAGINELRDDMKQTGARTLGEHFARLDPFQRRIRQRWTARSMYEEEFDAIWQAQAAHYPQILTAERQKELRAAIFRQRPLWFPDSLVGTCELEPGEPRVPKYSFVAQRFRLLQSVKSRSTAPSVP
jgi:CRISPR-associated endonuclease Csn1